MFTTSEMKGHLLRELSADRTRWLAPTWVDATPNTHSPTALVERVEFFRLDASRRLDPHRRQLLGQFLTPVPVAALMAGMFDLGGVDTVKLLDAGAESAP